MWLIFALLTTLSWAFADLFYKKGAVPEDKTSHIKTIIMVGFVMGTHGFIYAVIKGVEFTPSYLLIYFPVSSLYILSMAIGYLGLRYIELSISSPVQNSSGAITSILIFIFFAHILTFSQTSAIIIISLGVVFLAIEEKRLKTVSQIFDDKNRKYRKSIAAIVFPILYCIIDGMGTFADAIYLDELSLIGEDEALLAYEFTFLLCAIIALAYLKTKKININLFREKDKGLAAIFETVGQFFYVFAMAKNAIIVAPLISSYSIFSVLLSRLFLKERLTRNQNFAVTAVMSGIILLALTEV